MFISLNSLVHYFTVADNIPWNILGSSSGPFSFLKCPSTKCQLIEWPRNAPCPNVIHYYMFIVGVVIGLLISAVEWLAVLTINCPLSIPSSTQQSNDYEIINQLEKTVPLFIEYSKSSYMGGQVVHRLHSKDACQYCMFVCEKSKRTSFSPLFALATNHLISVGASRFARLVRYRIITSTTLLTSHPASLHRKRCTVIASNLPVILRNRIVSPAPGF